jgi:hypothetical protein
MVVENNDNTGWFGCSLTWRIKGYGETGGENEYTIVTTSSARLDLCSELFPAYQVMLGCPS